MNARVDFRAFFFSSLTKYYGTFLKLNSIVHKPNFHETVIAPLAFSRVYYAEHGERGRNGADDASFSTHR
jgi:hypothetical protein